MSIEKEVEIEDVVDIESKYKLPPKKTIAEILATHKEDESLRRYKEALLGQAHIEKIIVEPNDPREVIVKKLALLVQGREPIELDLTGDLSKLKKTVISIKEGVDYKIRIDFVVQREIVHGLKYVQKTYRMFVPVDKTVYMVGSYPPKREIRSFLTPLEEAPFGMIARGHYSVSSLFTDDDENVHLKWNWAFEIKKDWSENQ